MVHEMQQRISLPDHNCDDDKDGTDILLESLESSSRTKSNVDSTVAIEKRMSSSSLSDQSSLNRDKDISWKKMKRARC